MKNLFLSIAILISFTAYSQDKETLAGLKVGTTLPGTIHGGFLIDHSFNKNIGFECEIIYNQKDVSLSDNKVSFYGANGSLQIQPSDLKYKMHYLQVPLNIKVTFGDKLKPYAMAGLAVGYLLSSSNNTVGTAAYPLKVNNIDWSYLASIGVDYKPIFIEVRYNGSFNPAVYSNNGGRIENYYNKNLMISIGVKF